MEDLEKCRWCGAFVYAPCQSQFEIDRCELHPFSTERPPNLMKLHDETMRKLKEWVEADPLVNAEEGTGGASRGDAHGFPVGRKGG